MEKLLSKVKKAVKRNKEEMINLVHKMYPPSIIIDPLVDDLMASRTNPQKSAGLRLLAKKINENRNILGPLSEYFEYESSMPEYHRRDPGVTFLLRPDLQREALINKGYIPGTENDYGLVSKAVGNNKYPVYQTAKDGITRDQLTPIGNLNDMYFGFRDTSLAHAGYHYPTTVYIDNKGKFYQKAWDLNDYGGSGGSTASIAGKILDKLGNPFVVNTGFQPISVKNPQAHYGGPEYETEDELYWNEIEPRLNKVKDYKKIMREKYGLLPDVTVTQKSPNYLEYLFSNNPSLQNIINNLRNKSSHPLVMMNQEE